MRFQFFPDFLERILRLAASTLTEGEKIVIVCDALDEAGTFPDHFVFGLPKELPDGVYFILSQRPVNVKLPNFEPVIEKLEAQGEGNLQDIGAYLSAVAKRPEVAGQIRSKKYSEEFFIQTLKEKSQGVWMYLHYIIKEIESGAHAPLDLANLPTGLVGYYAEYWDSWRTGKRGKGEETWDDLYAPLLTTLAAAQEAIPVDWLIQWADVTAKPREVTRLLTEHWRAFITEKEKDGQKTYTPYHLSFKDFITGRVDTDKLSPTQANLVKDLTAQTVDAHKRIVNAYEAECNSEWEKLVDRDYSRLHLTAHLNGAEEYEKLRIMLTEGDKKIKWAEAREKKEETYAGYLNDLTYVWDYADNEQDYALAIRCMLIENSIHSQAANVPPELLTELAKAGIWSYARCLEVIRQKADPYDVVNSLELLASNLSKTLINEALSVAFKINDKTYRVGALVALIPYLDNESKTVALQDALSAAFEIEEKYPRVYSLSSLLPYLAGEIKAAVVQEGIRVGYDLYGENSSIVIRSFFPNLYDEAGTLTSKSTDELDSNRPLNLHDTPPQNFDPLTPQNLQDELSEAYKIKDETHRAQTLFVFALQFTGELKTQTLQDALASGRKIDFAGDRANVLCAFVPHLNDDLKKQALQDALAAMHKIEHKNDRAKVLSLITPHLTEKFKEQLLQDELAATHEINDKWTRINTLSSLLPYLDNETKERTINVLLTITCEPEDEYRYVGILRDIAPYLYGKYKALALDVACRMIDEYSRVSALSSLAPYLDNELKMKLLDTTREISDESDRAWVLSTIAGCYDNEIKADLIQEVLASAHKIKDKYHHVEALNNLLPHLNGELKIQTFQDALTAGFRIADESKRIRALSILAPYMDDEIKDQLLTIIYDIKDDFTSAFALPALAPYLNSKLKTQALQEAITAIYRMNASPEVRIRALSKVVPHLNIEERFLLLKEVIYWHSGSEILSNLRDTEFERFRKYLVSFIRFMSKKNREDGMDAVGNLPPALVHFRGPEIADELYRTITDVTRWWP